MKQKHTLLFTISYCFILMTSSLLGQEKKVEKQENNDGIEITNDLSEIDSIPVYKKKYGLRVGLDIAKPILSAVKDNYDGFEIVGDYRIKKNLYVAAEIGYAKQMTRRDTYAFTSKGQHISVGVNWNTFKNWLEMDNEIYVGARYGFSLFDQTLDNYKIYQQGTTINGIPQVYFDTKENTIPKTYKDQTAQWFSLLFGLKVETLKNLFLGAYVQFNFLLDKNEIEDFEILNIPGFNKLYSSRTGIGFGYAISYRIPLYKK